MTCRVDHLYSLRNRLNALADFILQCSGRAIRKPILETTSAMLVGCLADKYWALALLVLKPELGLEVGWQT